MEYFKDNPCIIFSTKKNEGKYIMKAKINRENKEEDRPKGRSSFVLLRFNKKGQR